VSSTPTAGSGTAIPSRRDTQLALLRLAAVVIAGVVLAVALHAVNVLVVVLAIVAMIMLHELGHFVAAKASGMKVTEYFLGFGPRLWSVRKGETEYGVKAIPAGGYVKITGMTMLEDVAAADEVRSYRQASFPRRLAVAVAGSAMHMLIALALCWSYFVFVGVGVSSPPTVSGMLHFEHGKTPAQLAGLRVGDRIVSIDGRKISSFTVLQHEIGPNAGRRLSMVVARDGRFVHLSITPANSRKVTEVFQGQVVNRPSKAATGIIGVELSTATNQPVAPLRAVPRSFEEFGSIAAATGAGISKVFSFHGLSQFAHSVATAGHHQGSGSGAGSGSSGSSGSQSAGVTSILGIIEIGSQAANQDVGFLLLLLAEVNLFVGLVNLFPMLPLDGGHVAIAVYERLRSRRGRRYHADVLKLMPVAYVFLAFIVVLGLGALYANIVQPVQLPGG
jgi:membrane-associated protease RseP (regulator of RpoE activity)